MSGRTSPYYASSVPVPVEAEGEEDVHNVEASRSGDSVNRFFVEALNDGFQIVELHNLAMRLGFSFEVPIQSKPELDANLSTRLERRKFTIRLRVLHQRVLSRISVKSWRAFGLTS
jgi:hypothetical protein